MMHFNVHKTFTGPHGAGGPGAGPIAVREFSGRLSARPDRRRATRAVPASRLIGSRRPPNRSAACARFSATSAFCCEDICISARWALTD